MCADQDRGGRYKSKLLAAKEARKLVEQDAQLRANRIALLKASGRCREYSPLAVVGTIFASSAGAYGRESPKETQAQTGANNRRTDAQTHRRTDAQAHRQTRTCFAAVLLVKYVS